MYNGTTALKVASLSVKRHTFYQRFKQWKVYLSSDYKIGTVAINTIQYIQHLHECTVQFCKLLFLVLIAQIVG
jgi:hypothetical protein